MLPFLSKGKKFPRLDLKGKFQKGLTFNYTSQDIVLTIHQNESKVPYIHA